MTRTGVRADKESARLPFTPAPSIDDAGPISRRAYSLRTLACCAAWSRASSAAVTGPEQR